jgi:dihydrofolate reductase
MAEPTGVTDSGKGTPMRNLIYSMTVSLDGFIAGRDGDFAWSAPDEELHRFHNQQTRELGGHLLGRRLYETMVYWETAEQQHSLEDFAIEFARIWKELPKVVFSTTLETVVGNTRLVRDGVAEEVARLKAETGKDLAVGGAGLAAELMKHDLIDEFRPFVYPVVVGGGTPFFPALDEKIDLELLETRTFGGRVVYLRYRRASD